MRRHQPTRGRADVEHLHRQALGVLGKARHVETGPCHHDSLVVVATLDEEHRNRLRVTLLLGQHITPWPHLRHINLLAGKRHRDTSPVVGNGQFNIDTDLVSHQLIDRLPHPLGVSLSRLLRPEPNLEQRPLGLSPHKSRGGKCTGGEGS